LLSARAEVKPTMPPLPRATRAPVLTALLLLPLLAALALLSAALVLDRGLGPLPEGARYDAIIVAVNHTEYANKDEAWFMSMMTPKGILVDLKGIYRNLGQRFWLGGSNLFNVHATFIAGHR
jgi:hypothetical protein